MKTYKEFEKKSEIESAAPFKKQLPRVIVVLLFACIGAYTLYLYQPEAEKKIAKDEPPFAEYIVANMQPISIPILSQGSVKAKTIIKLVSEVNGRVIRMNQLRFNGGFFKKGDLLLRIDDTEYQLKLTKAKSLVAAAKQKLIKVETEAGQAMYDLKHIGRDPSRSSSYALREPQLMEAQANLHSAQADLKIAILQIERTKIKAPFDGRVISKKVDVAQYVSAGTVLAEIYSTESVIVRLPLRLNQADLLGLELHEEQKGKNKIKINLSTVSINKIHQWQASLSHIEGEIDVRNRLIYLVAEIDSPFAHHLKHLNRPPLTPGMFVKAKLSGAVKNIIKLPRAVLKRGGNVWVIDEESKLKILKIGILYKDEKFIYVNSGLKQGYKVITSPIDYPLNGMRLISALDNDASPIIDDVIYE